MGCHFVQAYHSLRSLPLPAPAPPAAELLCFLRDAVDTRKAPVMEVALDCIQKLISFRLLQGPVHHINHR